MPEESTSGARGITFVACVEHGALEEGLIRLAESLRRNGGEFASSSIVAVTPRRGASLKSSTLRRFDELSVDYVKVTPPNRHAWMPYTNKIFALREGEDRANGDLVAWLDSDMLILGDLEGLRLRDGEDLAACPRDKNIGSTGSGDEFEPYWKTVCAAAGLHVEDLPWVETTADAERIRLYWNSGVFVYRPETGFLDSWHEMISHLIDTTDASTLDKLFWIDQVALSLTAVAAGLTMKQLPGSLNYGIASHFKDHLTDAGLAAARVLHYHDSMAPAQWTWFLERIAEPLPETRDWLATLGPYPERSDLVRRAVTIGYKAERQFRRRLWSRSHGAVGLGR